MAWRIAGIDGWGGGQAILFFPPRRCEAPGLQEGIGHHGHQRVPMQPGPGSALEVVEAEFLFLCWCACSQIQRALIVAASC